MDSVDAARRRDRKATLIVATLIVLGYLATAIGTQLLIASQPLGHGDYGIARNQTIYHHHR